MKDTGLWVTATLCSGKNIITSLSAVRISKNRKCFGVCPEHDQ
jgi:hypothetical protein